MPHPRQICFQNYQPQFKADVACLEKWLDAEIDDGLDLSTWLNANLRAEPKVTYDASDARTLVLTVIDKGRQIAFKGKGFNTDKEPDRKLAAYTNLLSKRQDGPKSDHNLAVRMSTRTRYEKQDPVLTLGTIVRENDGSYWVCVQPLCDSVRLKGKTFSFPFLLLSTTKKDDHIGFVIEDGTTKELSLIAKPSSSSLRQFGPIEENEVRCKRDGESWYFLDSQNNRLWWIAELKPDHAQRVAYEYSQKISRVGLTESEWLRRWAGRGFGD